MALKFRTWWRPPRRVDEPHEDRTVSFLELFYDLVYVVLVAELAHALAGHLDVKHFLQFIFLFAIVWWAWLNGTTYHEYHANNDIRTRVFTFAQMFAVAGMAVFAHNAMGSGSAGFALFYGLFQVILCYLWWRLAAHDHEHHLENRPFVITFTVSTVLFLVSVFVPTPFRFYLWVLAVTVSLLQPLIAFFLRPTITGRESNVGMNFSPALIERFGLFNILVLAEVIVGVVSGLTHHEHLSIPVFITGGLGLCIAFAMWWLYFDFVSHRKPLANPLASTSWLYMHLFVSMSIVAAGAVVLYVVEHAGGGLEPTTRWFLVSAISVFLISVFVLMQCIQMIDILKVANRIASSIIFVVAIIIALLGLTTLTTTPLLVIIIALMMIPMIYAIVFWVTVMSGGDTHEH